MTTEELTKIQLVLTGDVPGGATYRTETLWATTLGTKEDGSLITRMENTSFFVPLGVGDIVRTQENADGIQQIVELIARGPMVSYTIYLTTEEEMDLEEELGEMKQRARAQYIQYELEQAGWEFTLGGALGIAPMIFVAIEPVDQEAINAFEGDLIRICGENGCTPELLTDPSDDISQGIIGLDLNLITEPSLEPVDTDYDAYEDPHWETSDIAPRAPEDAKALSAFLGWVNSVARTDSRAAQDLEQGRYDRVETLLSRLMSDPQDLPPLDGPIWKDEE